MSAIESHPAKIEILPLYRGLEFRYFELKFLVLQYISIAVNCRYTACTLLTATLFVNIK